MKPPALRVGSIAASRLIVFTIENARILKGETQISVGMPAEAAAELIKTIENAIAKVRAS